MLTLIHTLIPVRNLIKSPKYLKIQANTFEVASQNEKTTLLGKTKQDYASIVKWM